MYRKKPRTMNKQPLSDAGKKNVDTNRFIGPLKDCPDRPNCVCTQATRPTQQMPAIPFTGSACALIERLTALVSNWPRTRIVSHRSNYLHVAMRTPLFRFVDDVEFFADQNAQLLHFRSASRIGYSDLGVNRRRMAKIRSEIIEMLSTE